MPSHSYPASDWRSQSLFGISIKLWQLSDDADNRQEYNLVIPETPFAKTFLRSVMGLLRSDLEIGENVLAEIAKNTLSQLLIKEEVVAVEDEEERDDDGMRDYPEGEVMNSAAVTGDDEVEITKDVGINNNNNIKKRSSLVEEKVEAKSVRKTTLKADKAKVGKKKRRETARKTKKSDDASSSELYCTSCKVVQASLSALSNHVCLPPESCDDCGRRFRCKQDLTVHRLIHSSARPQKCPQCGQSFRHVQTLKRHQLAAHAPDGRKDFRCQHPDCGKAFAVRQYLKRHELLHSGEKPYVCPACGLRFSQAANLSKHSRLVHRKEENSNFVCEICGQTFVQQYYLKRHVGTTHRVFQ